MSHEKRCQHSTAGQLNQPCTHRKRGELNGQLFGALGRGSSASFHPLFHHRKGSKDERPKRIQNNPELLHSVLRPIPICGTNFLGSYEAYNPHKRTQEYYVEWSMEGRVNFMWRLEG